MLLSSRSQTAADVAVAELPLQSTTAQSDTADEYQHDLAKGPRITYSIVSIVCMLLLATMLG